MNQSLAMLLLTADFDAIPTREFVAALAEAAPSVLVELARRYGDASPPPIAGTFAEEMQIRGVSAHIQPIIVALRSERPSKVECVREIRAAFGLGLKESLNVLQLVLEMSETRTNLTPTEGYSDSQISNEMRRAVNEIVENLERFSPLR